MKRFAEYLFPRTQKFHTGDLVRVLDIPRAAYRRGHEGEVALVLGSYRELHGQGSATDTAQYCIVFRDGNRTAWWYDDELELMRANHNFEA